MSVGGINSVLGFKHQASRGEWRLADSDNSQNRPQIRDGLLVRDRYLDTRGDSYLP